MTSYGYGGGYSTTTYGAQGGADGGGFMGGASQSGSQETPGGSRTHGKETLRPVTIKQILDATIAHPDADPKLDGADLTQLTFIAQIRLHTPQTTNHTYRLDDGTSLIDVKQWIDPDKPSLTPVFPENTYVRVYGRLKAFNNKRHVGVHAMRAVTDFNEINYHFLEATATHLYFTRGPLHAGGAKPAGNAAAAGEGGGMFVEQDARGQGNVNLANMTAVGRKVFMAIQNAPQNNEGLHVQNIASILGLQINDVFKAGDELLGMGVIYTTVDDETWAVLEY